jgi:hypothetical protein
LVVLFRVLQRPQADALGLVDVAPPVVGGRDGHRQLDRLGQALDAEIFDDFRRPFADGDRLVEVTAVAIAATQGDQATNPAGVGRRCRGQILEQDDRSIEFANRLQRASPHLQRRPPQIWQLLIRELVEDAVDALQSLFRLAAGQRQLSVVDRQAILTNLVAADTEE